jgi:hypothetical protein
MRPYLVLCAALLIASAVFAQQPVPRPYGPGYYGFGPYVPLISTPMISLETVSPNPVGASNATTGLIAGATDSTLSQIQGSTSSTFTVPVWYQGGAPVITPEVNLWPEPLGREMRMMAEPPGPLSERGPRKEARAEWVYFSGSEHTGSVAAAAKPSVKPGHSYTNEDVTRQNDNNGMVHWDSKTEKIQ